MRLSKNEKILPEYEGPVYRVKKPKKEERHKQHCVKSIQIWNFFWSVFSEIIRFYGDLRSISPYSVRMQENTDQKKLHIWTLFTQRNGKRNRPW